MDEYIKKSWHTCVCVYTHTQCNIIQPLEKKGIKANETKQTKP